MFKFLAVLLIVFFLILIHEFGHFIVARRNGVKVHEFAIGFAPFVFTKKMFGTVFKFGLLPLGGFVRLHGEDSQDSKMLKDKTSFVSKTPWQKTKIICAGVVMNFLVFWVLLTINLIVGSDPLVLNQNDFQSLINSPQTTLTYGQVVESSTNKILEGAKFYKDESLTTFVNEQGPKEFTENMTIPEYSLYPQVSLPTMKILNATKDSHFIKGDSVLSINDKIVFSDQTLYDEIKSATDLNFKILRDGNTLYHSTILPVKSSVVTEVVEGSPAQIADVLPGFELMSIESIAVTDTSNLPNLVLDELAKVSKESLTYTFLVDGNETDIDIFPNENGTIGIYLQPINYSFDLGIDYTFDTQKFSVVNKPVQKYVWYVAPIKALEIGKDVAILSAKSIVGTFISIFSSFTVSDEIGGPIKVFQTGYEFVGIGGTALLSFIAMISLTLAVVNILPIPALDGGRLLFVIVEAFRARPLNPKYEAVIHGIGFIILLLLIIIISIFDIIRL
jgi:regulator of sigma E protease